MPNYPNYTTPIIREFYHNVDPGSICIRYIIIFGSLKFVHIVRKLGTSYVRVIIQQLSVLQMYVIIGRHNYT